MTRDPVAITFVQRAIPIDPTGGAAFGDAARALVRRCLARLDALGVDQDPELRGVAGDGVIVVLGDAGALPWVDGAEWIAVDPAAPGLHLPTNRSSNVPVAVLLAFVRAHGVELPCVVVPDEEALEIVPLGEARSLSRARLVAWLGADP